MQYLNFECDYDINLKNSKIVIDGYDNNNETLILRVLKNLEEKGYFSFPKAISNNAIRINKVAKMKYVKI